MKRNIILGIIIALLVICVAAEGFIIWKQNNESGKEQNQQVDETPTPIPSPAAEELLNEETLDGENLEISKKYIKPDENKLVYTYLTITVQGKGDYQANLKFDVPQINLTSEDIQKLNEEILKEYEDIANKMNEDQEIDFGCEGLSYEYYENDGILSLVLVNPTESGGYFNCKTYNIDISTEKELNNINLLKKIDITEKDLKDKILETINNFAMYQDNSQENAELETFAKEQKDRTVKKYKNIATNKLDLYINNDKHICAYMEVYSIAGGETTTIIFDLETSETIELR